MKLLRPLLLACSLLFASAAHAEKVTVAAAADLKWKRFLFLYLGEELGRPGLMPPHCDACDHYAACLAAHDQECVFYFNREENLMNTSP